MTIVLEEVDSILVGRIYIGETKTAAYIIPLDINEHLFSAEQLELINNQMF
jgi:hypothetical protein